MCVGCPVITSMSYIYETPCGKLTYHLATIGILGQPHELAHREAVLLHVDAVVTAERLTAHTARAGEYAVPVEQVSCRILDHNIMVTHKGHDAFFFRHILQRLGACVRLGLMQCAAMCEAVTYLGDKAGSEGQVFVQDTATGVTAVYAVDECRNAIDNIYFLAVER